MESVLATAPAAQPQDFIGLETVEFTVAEPAAAPHFALVASAGATFSPAAQPFWALNAPGGSVEFRLTLMAPHGVALILRLAGNGADSPVTLAVNGVNHVENFAPNGPGFSNVSWYIPETLLKAGDNALVVSVPGGTTPAQLADAYVMKFSIQPQKQDDWCWAAVTASIAAFFEDGHSDWTQCRLANELLGQTNCCTEGASAACDQPWSLSQALKQTGNLACHHAGAQPVESLREQISAGNPVGALINWQGGGSHFVVLTGVGPDEPGGAGATMIAVEDSLNGFSYVTYESFVTSYRGDGAWAHAYCTRVRDGS